MKTNRTVGGVLILLIDVPVLIYLVMADSGSVASHPSPLVTTVVLGLIALGIAALGVRMLRSAKRDDS